MKSSMLTKEQLQQLSKEYKINEYVVAREYFQLLLLKELYSKNFSQQIFFKGGTCIRLIYGGSRFSEDLDFTVETEEKEFEGEIQKFFKEMVKKYPVTFKEKDTIVGKTYLATIKTDFLKQKVYIKLDFSFREKVIKPSKEIIKDNAYPVVFRGFIYCLSKDEILAEKIRALISREKSRDLYDIWMLLELGSQFKREMIEKKLNYYDKEYQIEEVIKRIKNQSQENFEGDLRAFVPINDREKLGDFLKYAKEYIVKAIGD
jgi:predicted nucleotidyltransferase component of viral defense system